MTFVKGYTRSDGVVVKGHHRDQQAGPTPQKTSERKPVPSRIQEQARRVVKGR